MLIYAYLLTFYLNSCFSAFYINLHFLVSLFFESETNLYLQRTPLFNIILTDK